MGSFIDGGLADALFFFYAPKLLGDESAVPVVAGRSLDKMASATRAFDIRVRQFDGDVMVSGRFHEQLY
jgi:riboflavin biosynthesis pyrimidine reductase